MGTLLCTRVGMGMFWILVEIGFDVLIGNHFVMNVVGYTDWGWGGAQA